MPVPSPVAERGLPPDAASPAAAALQACRRGDVDGAAAIVARIVREAFHLDVRGVQIARDGYSLNSVNGIVALADGGEYFFKFHHEEGEERTLQELYRGELLLEAGYPVDTPVHVSREVGRQLLLYRRRHERRFADVCAEHDGRPAATWAPLARAQRELDARTLDIYLRTLHPVDGATAAREPIHQLFHHRLVDAGAPQRLGGRARRFFWDRGFDIAGVRVPAARLRGLRWRVNGVAYRDGLGELLERSRRLLEPSALARYGGVTAHGDAHNANVWWEIDPARGAPRLSLFDPAFAGTHVCTMLAEVKATFHNIFAHPLWLYAPARAGARYGARATLAGETLQLETDWNLSALRERFLHDKAQGLWRPLLRELQARGLLDPAWRATLRCALFCCPALVMDLCAGGAGGHDATSSAIGLAVAIGVGSEAVEASGDVVSEFLDAIDPAPPRRRNPGPA